MLEHHVGSLGLCEAWGETV